MAMIPWFRPVRERKTLEVFPGRSVSASWMTAFNAAVTDFNSINLGITLVTGPNVKQPDPNNVSGADVWVEVGTQQQFKVFGSDVLVQVPIDAGGKTQPVGGAGQIVKQLIVVKTLMTTGTHPRPFGEPVHRCTLFHEFIHALGLDGNEHTFDDIFSSVITPQEGATPQTDFVVPITGLKSKMPPIVVGPRTRSRIQSNWQ